MDLLKVKQIRSIMQEVENTAISTSSTSSEEDDRDRLRKAKRRTSSASEERWAQSISSSSLGPSIWGATGLAQERGRASRSASFSVGQELSNAPIMASGYLSPEQETHPANDQTRLLREQFQQMKFKNRSKSSYAAAWHVPDFDEDGGSEDAVLDDGELVSRLRRGDPPGLKYTTPTNPRLDSLRDRERRASFNVPLSHPIDGPRSPNTDTRSSYDKSRRDSTTSRETSHSLLQNHSGSSHTSYPEANNTDNYGKLNGSMLADVDRYFSSDDHRTRTRTHLAQTAAAQSAMLHQAAAPMPSGLLYIVEFKACRTDVFYVAEGSGFVVRVGDLVIVEADRGRDLGKVTRENVTPAQVKALKAQQAREQALAMGAQQDESEKIHATTAQPKLIYRLSQPSEIAMLLVKSQDEQQAMLVAQAKVRQRKLPMEVLDCEYQWDRRKLTFYYYASQRIDFRELVRDLFKIYKTRIWLCAVNPTSISNANSSLGAPGAIGEPKQHAFQNQDHVQYTAPLPHHEFTPQAMNKSGGHQMDGYMPYGYTPGNFNPYSPYIQHQMMY